MWVCSRISPKDLYWLGCPPKLKYKKDLPFSHSQQIQPSCQGQFRDLWRFECSGAPGTRWEQLEVGQSSPSDGGVWECWSWVLLTCSWGQEYPASDNDHRDHPEEDEGEEELHVIISYITYIIVYNTCWYVFARATWSRCLLIALLNKEVKLGTNQFIHADEMDTTYLNLQRRWVRWRSTPLV